MDQLILCIICWKVKYIICCSTCWVDTFTLFEEEFVDCLCPFIRVLHFIKFNLYLVTFCHCQQFVSFPVILIKHLQFFFYLTSLVVLNSVTSSIIEKANLSILVTIINSIKWLVVGADGLFLCLSAHQYAPVRLWIQCIDRVCIIPKLFISCHPMRNKNNNRLIIKGTRMRLNFSLK